MPVKIQASDVASLLKNKDRTEHSEQGGSEGGGGVVCCTKCLPCEHGDLSLISRAHIRMPIVVTCAVILAVVWKKQVGGWGEAAVGGAAGLLT